MTLTVPTVTGWQGIQHASNINGEYGTAYAPLFSRSSHERRASIALSRSGFRAARAIMKALTGAAAGDTATDTYVRAGTDQQGPTLAGPGGARNMETVTTVNAATTAGQETAIEARIVDGLFAQAPSSYPTDASGNGGGGKVGV